MSAGEDRITKQTMIYFGVPARGQSACSHPTHGVFSVYRYHCEAKFNGFPKGLGIKWFGLDCDSSAQTSIVVATRHKD